MPMDFQTNLTQYFNGNHDSDGREPDARYTSFDYCFNYFQAFREADDVSGLVKPANIQLSCLHLGFYLASWGMFRGRARLLQKSARHLMPVIKLISEVDGDVWKIDAN